MATRGEANVTNAAGTTEARTGSPAGGRTMVVGVHHAGIVVSDLDRSIDFYTKVLGLELTAEPSAPSSGPVLDILLRLEGARVRGAMLAAGANALELLEFSAPERQADGAIPAHAVGAQHVAFQVADVRAARAVLEGRGVRFLGEVNVIDEGPFAGLRTTFLLDPDDVRVELVEVAYRNHTERRREVAAYWASRP